MKRKLIIYYAVILLVTLVTSCAKVIDKFNSNNLTVTFSSPTALFLTADKTVNPKDSLKFSYSVTCTTPMTYLTLTKNDNEIARDSIKTGDRMSFSAIKKLVADTIPGQYVYKVVARDANSVYLGSSSSIVVTVASDFTYYTNQRLYVPDSTAKTSKTYYNFATQSYFSYSDITATTLNSGKIDLGYFFDTDSVKIGSGTSQQTVAKGHTIYNLNLSPTPTALTIYNTSTFTKNLTLFKRITTPTWANLNSGGILKATAKSNLTGTLPNSISLSLNDAKSATATPAGSVIIFKTVDGKIGALQVLYVNANSAARTTYVNFEVKMVN